ncbi:MAG: hypothetical protein CVU24_11520 [Betaproteobacteria bacterium HGW-Betaproteobacteria-18]|nr:MAG: hypothetical protein CVU24_11520 [Betaproteobacteria bacterium HGW-Betaproteobacteria-18]
MTRMRGWGLLLAVGVPLLIFFSWSRLGAEKSRINLERFEAWAAAAGDATALTLPLVKYFLENGKLAESGDVTMPAIPEKSGIKAWTVQADSTVRVDLDAKIDGRPVQLTYVPVVRSATTIFYDCVSPFSTAEVGRICPTNVLQSVAAIPDQLAANAQILHALPAVVSAAGVSLHADTATGSVVVVPQDAARLNDCGFQCVKPQSCATPRPLACSQWFDKGDSGWLEVAATSDDFPGYRFATRGEADKACAQSLGDGYKVLGASSISGVFKLVGGNEYWVHNEMKAEANCWKTDPP